MLSMIHADTEIQADRLVALQRGGVDALVALFRRVPSVAEYVQDVGPLVEPWARTTDNWTLRRLATYLASPSGTQLLLAHADRNQHQLLALAVWHGGVVDRDQALAESGMDRNRLDEAVDGLGELLLVDSDRGWLVARPGVLDYISPPGPMIRPGVERVVSRDIAVMLDNLGVSAGTRKAERVDALEAAVRDADVLLPALDALDGDSRKMFDRILAAGQLGRGDLDDDGFDSGIERYRIRQHSLSVLRSLGVVGTDDYSYVAWVWFDVVVTLSGGLFATWEPVDLDFVDSDAHLLASVPESVGLLDRILGYLRTNPAPALQSGGMGVKAVRAVGKALDIPGPTVGLLVALAIELGLIGQSSLGSSGRGRNRRHVLEWRPAAAAQGWASAPPGERWQQLVAAWLSSVHIPLGDKPVERYDFGTPFIGHALLTGLLIRHMGDIPPGRATDRAALAGWLAFRYASLLEFDVAAQLIAQATVLGLIDHADHVALTPLTRHLLAGDDLSDVVAGGTAVFVVQADHTVIAPPDLAADVALQLGTIASLESHSGARVYRIDDQSLLSAFDAGLDADEVVDFLAAHSSARVPDVVERVIRDAFARHGRLRVGSTSTWLACDDPALLSQAVAVRGAKLTAVSPTAAVSDQPRAKVMGALRAAGVAAVDVTTSDNEEGPPEVRPSWVASNARRRPDLSADGVALAGLLIDGQVISKAPPEPASRTAAQIGYNVRETYDEEGW